MVSGIDLSVPTTKERSADGFIHAESGDVSNDFNESVQFDDNEILQTKTFDYCFLSASKSVLTTEQKPSQHLQRQGKQNSYDQAYCRKRWRR